MTVRSTDSHSGAVILIDTIVLNEGELNSESLSRKGVCLTDTLTSNEGKRNSMPIMGVASTDPLAWVYVSDNRPNFGDVVFPQEGRKYF